MNPHLLATTYSLGTFSGIGTLGSPGSFVGIEAFITFTKVLSTVIGILTVSAGLWFMMQIFSGGYQWLTSGGDKQALENARKRITHAIIGLLIVVLGYAIISIIGLVFGFNILNPAHSLNIPGA